jgi:hypothetical protein
MGGGYSAGYGNAPSHQWHQDKDTSDHLDHISKGNQKVFMKEFLNFRILIDVNKNIVKLWNDMNT